jgi:hypothetical protein
VREGRRKRRRELEGRKEDGKKEGREGEGGMTMTHVFK